MTLKQTSAREAIYVALLAARSLYVRRLNATETTTADSTKKKRDAEWRLVCYCSRAADAGALERAAHLALLRVELLEPDAEESLRGQTLSRAIERDRARGLLPFFLSATVGTPATCAIDNVRELGDVCRRERLWMHVNADYAGAAAICPEYRSLLEGVDAAQSVCISPHRLLQCGLDCSAMWFADHTLVSEPFMVAPQYFPEDEDSEEIPEFRVRCRCHSPWWKIVKKLLLFFVL